MKIIVAIAALAGVIAVSPPAWASTPTDQLREYTETVIKVLEDPALKSEERKPARRAAVRKVAVEAFDVQETARRALGTHWQARTPAEREEFVLLFAELLEETYISRIDYFGGERLRFVSEKIDGEYANVRAHVITRQGTEVPVDARMLRRGERWLIYDVVIENVSLINNYRAQFDRIIRSASYGELVKRLKSRSEPAEAPKPDAKPRRTSR
ncbi:MAG TPA: ABC transporter substrate-binding protein [Candidatus Limnocylindria bacterium]|nr:ABC transporter substrate-binding protein [Candidatus Limnocylindria bacterium]